MADVLDSLNRSGDGSVDYDEFLRALKGRLSPRRRRIVLKAFDLMDRDGSGVIDLNDIKAVFNAKKHPEVLQGKLTADEALLTFLEGFEGRYGNRDGKVTQEEWIDYYTGKDESISSLLEAGVRLCWSEGEVSRAGESTVEEEE